MADVLQSLSDALAGAVEATGPGIVRVDGRRRFPGSGIVWSSDGIIVTAHHIIERNENISVGLPGEVSAPATLVGRDPNTDLAVLRVQADVTPAQWSDEDDLKVGHLVLALGRPGESVQATLGVVSAIHGEHRHQGPGHGHSHGHGRGRGRGRWDGPAGDLIQTDVVMYPGFSGGPLVDTAGFVRGLNTSALSRGSSLTIPTTSVRKVVEALLSHGKVQRGYLGIGAQPVRLAAGVSEAAGQEIGLMVASVEEDSPAEKGGLLQGDIVIGLDGESVQVIDELLMMLDSDKVGQDVTVRIVRGGQIQDLTVTVSERN
ncbi:MAG: S1C family serine protease [Anaerolineae bacterium]|nr:S1C family serine protease [Anaerolineae bacterium]